MRGREALPSCDQASSVRAPMYWGVAFVFVRRDSSSTIWPMEYHRAALRRCAGLSAVESIGEVEGRTSFASAAEASLSSPAMVVGSLTRTGCCEGRYDRGEAVEATNSDTKASIISEHPLNCA
jgi:hypothetical protein